MQHHPRHIRHTRKLHATRYLLVSAAVFMTVFGMAQLIRSYSGHTLPYASEMSNDSLLQATNKERAANGLPLLNLDEQLMEAAQTKAADMVARDYWSHDTPDGSPPWTFLEAVRYRYLKAGENLAYGFKTSAGTVNGWMNSPSHKANMLDPIYTEVGFGYVNSNNYQHAGQQTVVVAMYGAPATIAGTTESTPALPLQNAASPFSETAQQYAVGKPVQEAQPYVAASQSEARRVSFAQAILGTSFSISTTAIVVLLAVLVTVYVTKHVYALHRIVVRGERFVIHHPMLDIAFASFIVAAYIASRTSGFIQ